MKYKNSQHFDHSQSEKIGVLVTNLGTPDAPTAKALRPYLKQFLWDPRVVEVPRLIWWLVLNGIILNTRPKKSAEAYKTVWTEDGSPLAHYTSLQADALQKKLHEKYGDDLVVAWAMRYGNPSISLKLQELFEKGVTKLVVLPLYPQYSAATTGSTFDALANDFKARRWLPELRFINQYVDNEDYIASLVRSIEEHWEEHGRAEKLIFSYHGIPLRYLHNGDPYHCQCHKTTRLVVEKLGLKESDYITTFQSRFGREEWLKPYTDHTMKSLPKKGVKSVQVICPGFSSDCLETIEEIGEENREYFMHAGGEKYEYIPALNDRVDHIQALTNLIEKNLEGWYIQTDNGAARKRRFDAHEHNRK